MTTGNNADSKVIIVGMTSTGEQIPAASGRISTQPGTALEILEASRDAEKNASLIAKVTRSGHNSTVEHTVFNLAFQNVSVMVEQFVIEFRLASFTVKSRRYVDFANLGCYKPAFGSKSLEDRYDAHMNYLYGEYGAFIDAGIPKEDARFVLPYSLFSNFFCTLNARELLNMLYSMIYGRGSSFTELRTLGLSLYEQAKAMTPGIFTDFEVRRPAETDRPSFPYKPDRALIAGESSVELLSCTPKAAASVARAALTECCALPTEQINSITSDENECRKIVASVIASRRRRALEAITCSFRINGISLACVTHFTRHRMQSLSVPPLTLTDRRRHITPPSIEENEVLLSRYNAAFVSTAALYDEFKSAGVNEDLLTYLQLSGNAVDILTTINGRELLLFMKLRACNRAQWEIRFAAIEMLKKLREVSPEVFDFYGPSCYVSKCPEGALTCGKSAEVIEKFKNL